MVVAEVMLGLRPIFYCCRRRNRLPCSHPKVPRQSETCALVGKAGARMHTSGLIDMWQRSKRACT